MWKQQGTVAPDIITGQEVEHIIKKPAYASLHPKGTGMPYVTNCKTAYIGQEMSRLMMIATILAFAVAIAYNIHIFSYFRGRMRIHGERRKAVIETLREIGWSVFFCGFTTLVSAANLLARFLIWSMVADCRSSSAASTSLSRPCIRGTSSLSSAMVWVIIVA